MHRRQIELLRHWRAEERSDDHASDPTFIELLVTVSAIASGLRPTGYSARHPAPRPLAVASVGFSVASVGLVLRERGC